MKRMMLIAMVMVAGCAGDTAPQPLPTEDREHRVITIEGCQWP